jgi:hypothetical protein
MSPPNKIPQEVSEFDDPEASYRRGFHQGAWLAVTTGPFVSRPKLLEWAGIDLHRWRWGKNRHERMQPPPLPDHKGNKPRE